MRATPVDVRYVYRLLLGREPDVEGYRHNCALVEEKGLNTLELARHFMESVEFHAKHIGGPAYGEFPKPIASTVPLDCQACTQSQIESANFKYWASRLHELPGKLHRKLWEWCFIAQALHERDMLRPGMRGLGFAVGTEPLTSLFAGAGCSILATDLRAKDAALAGWVATNQNAAGLEDLNKRCLCSADDFLNRVSFRLVDMRDIPSDIAGFDFLWSSCAMEYLGSLRDGLDFLLKAMNCLRPGGIAVHTTEFNCDTDVGTVESGNDVVYRRRDFLELSSLLAQQGHQISPFDFTTGSTDADLYVDEPPYNGKIHLKLRIGGFCVHFVWLDHQEKRIKCMTRYHAP